MHTIDATPRASILIESMRDIGYSLQTALADIIDNSIAANAEKIQVFANVDDPLRIGILDDGEGMTEKELHSAMRPGSQNPLNNRDHTDLGRFGLGLKTASFSQCRQLTVVTRNNGSTNVAIWDLDHVARVDKWQVQIPENYSDIPWIDELSKSGTLIIWDKLDRLIEEVNPEKVKEEFIRHVDDTREHLELVFHRFIAGERGLKKINISLNNRPLVPFDPFNSNHPATIVGPVEKIKVGDYKVVIQTFTLPHHRKVSKDEWERYAGSAGYLKNQGFYVYRQRRLIVFGTWFKLARQSELTKLARVRIDMPNGLDAEWKIDVKKASAQPPRQVRERLRRIIESIGAMSKRVYTKKGQNLIDNNQLPVWIRVQDKNEIYYQLNRAHPVFSEYYRELPDELKLNFQHVLELAEKTLPIDALFADMGGSPEKVGGKETSVITLQYTVETTIKHLKDSGLSLEKITEMLSVSEPFISNWERTKEILENLHVGGNVDV